MVLRFSLTGANPKAPDTCASELCQPELLGRAWLWLCQYPRPNHLGKWLFEPVGGIKGLSDDEAKAKGTDFLFADLRQRVASGDAVFKFNLELAEAGDKLDNPTVPLPAGRKKVELDTLKVTAVAAEGQGACQGVTFTPTVLPKGVLAGNDPVLATRAAPYGISLDGRTAEAGAK